MPKDDIYVIMYKILAYLYKCMKSGIEPQLSKWDAEAMAIPQSYWNNIVEQMMEHNFISGVECTHVFGGETIIDPVNPAVTMEGVQFARENTMMAKAKKFLQDTKAAVPFI